MRKLRVDFEEVVMAMEDQGTMEWYLDVQSGEVIPVPEEGTLGEEDSELSDMIDANPSRFVEIPTLPSQEGYDDMAAFAATVKNAELERLLGAAMNGRGAFRRFKDALTGFPQERERWFRFKADRMEERILKWFHEDLELDPEFKRRLP